MFNKGFYTLCMIAFLGINNGYSMQGAKTFLYGACGVIVGDTVKDTVRGTVREFGQKYVNKKISTQLHGGLDSAASHIGERTKESFLAEISKDSENMHCAHTSINHTAMSNFGSFDI